MSLLDVKNLKVSFHTRNGEVKAVDDVSFSVESGKITAIIGESGSGKSVACYSLLGLIPTPPGKIEGGQALFEGTDLLQMSEPELRKIRGRDIAMIFQNYALWPHMTVAENVFMGQQGAFGVGSRRASAHTRNLLHRPPAGLEHRSALWARNESKQLDSGLCPFHSGRGEPKWRETPVPGGARDSTRGRGPQGQPGRARRGRRPAAT